MALTVELLHIPGCERCVAGRQALHEAAQAAAGDGLIWRELDVIENLDYAVGLGVMTLPAVIINGQLAFSCLPTPDQLRRALAALSRPGASHGS